LAEPFTRLTLYVRFRRRGQTQEEDNVDALFSNVIQKIGIQSVHEVILNADRGYGKVKMLQTLLSRGLCALFVMPEHLLQCHPFVAKYFLRCGRLDEDEDDEKEDKESSDNSDCDIHSSMDVNFDDVALARAAPHGIDRPRAFVIDDAPDQPPSVFYATRQVKGRSNSGRQSSRQKAVAVAVRERGTSCPRLFAFYTAYMSPLLIYEREDKPCFSLELSHIQFINYSLHIVDIFHVFCHDISIVITSLVTRTTHIYSNTMCRALLLIIACVYRHLTVF
jgi:hypothetical protein